MQEDRRELLLLAAKAAGYRLDGHTQKPGAFTRGGVEWNPYVNGDDALRLAVKLRLDIDHHESCVNVWDRCVGTGFIPNGDDPDAATRYAIVLAAAAIGKAMP